MSSVRLWLQSCFTKGFVVLPNTVISIAQKLHTEDCAALIADAATSIEKELSPREKGNIFASGDVEALMSIRKLIFSINLSLDGFADHTVAIADDELHEFFIGELERTSIELFGRRTYQLMEGYWPHAHEDPAATKVMRAFAEHFNAIPKIVFSKTLEKAEWSNTTLHKGDMVQEVRRLKDQPGKNLSIGGISASQSLMRQGLIDEYLLLVHPIVVTKGRRLFEDLAAPINLKLVDTKTFKSGVIVLRYENK